MKYCFSGTTRKNEILSPADLPRQHWRSLRREGWSPSVGFWGGGAVGGTPSTPRLLAGVSLAFLASSSSSVQSSRHSKLEKADILEMTVKHLRNLQRAQMTGEGGWPHPPRRASLSPGGDFFQTSARGCERHSATFYCLGSLLRSHGLGLFIATTPSCYCSGKGGRVVAAARAAGGLAVGKAGGGQRA